MAKNKKATHDTAAAKAKKQKIILGVAGVALLGLGVIQGPKLLQQGSPAAADATPAAAGVVVTSGSSTERVAIVNTSTGTAFVVNSRPKTGPRAILAGVTIKTAAAPGPAEGQLHSFNLFALKDPFVPQTSDETVQAAPASTPPPPAPAPTSEPESESESAGSSATSGGSGSASAPTEAAAPPSDATIILNGRGYALTLRERFPKADPLFVLTSLKLGVAKIAVAGGSFADGKTIALKMGKKVTLVNSATGVRYVLKLVYAGNGPEQTESFTQAKE